MRHDEQREEEREKRLINHELSDHVSGAKVANACETAISIKFTNGSIPWTFFDKDDVIAMAKFFNITEKDLKDD